MCILGVLSHDEENQIISIFNNKEAMDDFSVVMSYYEIASNNYSLSAGQYFEVKIDRSDITSEQFSIKMREITESFDELFKQSKELETNIKTQLAGLKYE